MAAPKMGNHGRLPLQFDVILRIQVTSKGISKDKCESWEAQQTRRRPKAPPAAKGHFLPITRSTNFAAKPVYFVGSKS